MPKNIPKALEWYQRAADAGHPEALIGLAVIHATGDGVQPDREYAGQLLEQAEDWGLNVNDVRQQIGL